MADLRKVILGPVLCAAALTIAPRLFAQDAPVEHPSVDRPALPQSSQDEPAPVEHPSTAHPAQTSRIAPTDQRVASKREGGARNARDARDARDARRHRIVLYLGAGLGLLSGLGGGKDFERSNPAVTGLVGVELPLSRATGLGFELTLDAELAGQADRDSYTAALVRARLGRMLAPSARLWGALGIGRAGYRTGSLAGAVALGSTLMFVPKFGLDLSANLNLVGASSDMSTRALGSTDYNGGLVLLIALKAMFELHPTR